jgi:hypothetical protein
MQPVKSYGGSGLLCGSKEQGSCLTETQLVTRLIAVSFFAEIEDFRGLKDYLGFSLVSKDFHAVWNEGLGSRCDLLDQALTETCEVREPLLHRQERSKMFESALAFSKRAAGPSSAHAVQSLIHKIKDSPVLDPGNLRLWRSGVPFNLCFICSCAPLLALDCWAITTHFASEGNVVLKGLSAFSTIVLVGIQIWPSQSLMRAALQRYCRPDAPPYEDCCAVAVLQSCVLPMRSPILDDLETTDETSAEEEQLVDLKWAREDYLKRLEQDKESYPIDETAEERIIVSSSDDEEIV